jgi:uncharacterized iron-regulated membrane protein
MSFEWANTLLFRLTGSTPAVNTRGGDPRAHTGQPQTASAPNCEHLLDLARTFNPEWRTITLNIVHNAHAPVSATIDTGAGGQPQMRTQYLLNAETGAVIKKNSFADGSLGQRLRAFVRFGHTGEFGGWPSQLIAAGASLGACVLVYTGLSLSIRRLSANLRKKRTVAQREEASMSTV